MGKAFRSYRRQAQRMQLRGEIFAHELAGFEIRYRKFRERIIESFSGLHGMTEQEYRDLVELQGSRESHTAPQAEASGSTESDLSSRTRHRRRSLRSVRNVMQSLVDRYQITV